MSLGVFKIHNLFNPGNFRNHGVEDELGSGRQYKLNLTIMVSNCRFWVELQPRPGFRSPPHLNPKPSPTIEFRIERALTIQVTDGFHATVGGYGS